MFVKEKLPISQHDSSRVARLLCIQQFAVSAALHTGVSLFQVHVVTSVTEVADKVYLYSCLHCKKSLQQKFNCHVAYLLGSFLSVIGCIWILTGAPNQIYGVASLIGSSTCFTFISRSLSPSSVFHNNFLGIK